MPIIAGANIQPIVDYQVAFTATNSLSQVVSANPNDPTLTPIWTSLAHRLVTFRSKSGKTYELDQATAQEGQVRLRNTDGALDPTNTSSVYWPNVLPMRQARLVVTPPGGTATVVWTGYAEDWSQTWDLHGAYCWVESKIVDAFAPLSQIILNSCLASEVLLDKPSGYWLLSEPSGAQMGGQIASTGEPGVSPVQVGSGGTLAFGGTTLTTLVGAGATDGLSGPVQGNTTGVLLTPASTANGQYLQGSLTPTISTPLTLEVWFQCVSGATGVIAALTNGPINASIQIGSGGTLAATDTVRNLTSSSVVTNNVLHHAVLVITTAGSTLYLDGNSVATGGATNAPALATLSLGGYPAGNAPSLFPGTIAHAAAYPTALSAARIQAHYTAGTTAFAGEDSGARFSRILTYGPWNGPSSVPPGNSILQGATALAGKSVMAALLNVVDAEQGNMYVSAIGAVTFEPRHQRYRQLTDVWTLGENTGEQAYDGDGLEVGFDLMQVFNYVQVIRPGGIQVSLADAASALQNFPRGYPIQPFVLPVTDDNTPVAAAQYIIGRYRQPHARLTEVTLSPSKSPALWTFATTAKIGDRTAFNRRTQTAPTVSLDTFIESLSIDWNAKTGDFKRKVEASPSFWQNYGILTTTRGALNASVAFGATSIVVNVPTDAAGNSPAQNGWTKNVIPSLQIVDGANTETVTVTAMSISGQLVTVTVSALAHPHSAGVTVAEAPGTFTFNQFDAAAVLDGSHAVGY